MELQANKKLKLDVGYEFVGIRRGTIVFSGLQIHSFAKNTGKSFGEPICSIVRPILLTHDGELIPDGGCRT